MNDLIKKASRLPLAAGAATFVSILGIIYAFSLTRLLDLLHWYAFASSSILSVDEYDFLIRIFVLVQAAYYMLCFPFSVILAKRNARLINAALLILALCKLSLFVVTLNLGFDTMLQFGFDSLMEAYCFFVLLYLSRSPKAIFKTPHRWLTAGVTGVIIEIIPLVRNMQFLFVEQADAFVKITVFLLPLLTASVFFFTAMQLRIMKGEARKQRKDLNKLQSENPDKYQNKEHDSSIKTEPDKDISPTQNPESEASPQQEDYPEQENVPELEDFLPQEDSPRQEDFPEQEDYPEQEDFPELEDFLPQEDSPQQKPSRNYSRRQKNSYLE